MRATSGGTHLHGLTPGQHSCEETSQWWRAFRDTASDLTAPVLELQLFRIDSNILPTELTGRSNYVNHASTNREGSSEQFLLVKNMSFH